MASWQDAWLRHTHALPLPLPPFVAALSAQHSQTMPNQRRLRGYPA